MSISSRITSIEEHLKESYQELEGIGIDTTGVNNNLENIPKLLDGYWETLPKVTGEGTSITLDNTKEGKMKVLLKGNTYQDSTSGKQLLDTSKIVPFTPTVDAWRDLEGNLLGGTQQITSDTLTYEVQANQSYRFTIYEMSNMSQVQIVYNNNGSFVALSTLYSASGVTITPTTTMNIYIRCRQTSANVSTSIKCMLEEGSSSSAYEPYTNGASPNPDYPQEVHTVSGDNEVEVSNGDNTQSTTYPINLPEGMFLGWIGDYQDRFFKAVEGNPVYDSLDSATKQTLDSNEWYLEKKIGKMTFDGTISFSKSNEKDTYTSFFYLDTNFKMGSECICNRLKYVSQYGNITGALVEGIAMHGALQRVYISIPKTIANSSEALNTWLSSNNLIVYFILNTPTYTKIEGTLASQLEVLNGSKSYTGQTNISQNNNDMASVLNATALSE